MTQATTGPDVGKALALWDYRRRMHEAYAAVRTAPPGEAAWRDWRAARDRLFAEHPQSAIPASARGRFAGLVYYPYDPAWRLVGRVEDAPSTEVIITASDGVPMEFQSVGVVAAESPTGALRLTLYWLRDYAGGVFLPFRDATAGHETYRGGRYLLDTAKGADLGHEGDRIVMDFNYAYHPSCAYDAGWSCPLPPPENRVNVAVRAGERLAPATRTHSPAVND